MIIVMTHAFDRRLRSIGYQKIGIKRALRRDEGNEARGRTESDSEETKQKPPSHEVNHANFLPLPERPVLDARVHTTVLRREHAARCPRVMQSFSTLLGKQRGRTNGSENPP